VRAPHEHAIEAKDLPRYRIGDTPEGFLNGQEPGFFFVKFLNRFVALNFRLLFTLGLLLNVSAQGLKLPLKRENIFEDAFLCEVKSLMAPSYKSLARESVEILNAFRPDGIRRIGFGEADGLSQLGFSLGIRFDHEAEIGCRPQRRQPVARKAD
jgi:hypothetical protein